MAMSNKARPSMWSHRNYGGCWVTRTTSLRPSKARSAAIWAGVATANHDDTLLGDVGRGNGIHRVQLPTDEKIQSRPSFRNAW